jgi:hypothetical protein
MLVCDASSILFIEKAMLQGPAIKKISFEFITQYKADVIFLENVVTGFDFLREDEIFLELKQASKIIACD